MKGLRRLWPFYYWTEHDLNGYGGTWLRWYTLGFRTPSHSIAIQFRVSRHREIGR